MLVSGVEHVRLGYYCRVCLLFYSNEDTAKKTHCSSQTHYEKLQVRLLQLQPLEPRPLCYRPRPLLYRPHPLWLRPSNSFSLFQKHLEKEKSKSEKIVKQASA